MQEFRRWAWGQPREFLCHFYCNIIALKVVLISAVQ